MKKNHLLREARLKKGWSQRQLADFSGLSLSTIERAERGEPLRIDSIQLLCECLNKTPEELGLVKIEDRKEGINWEALATLTNHYAEILSKLADALGVTGDFLLGRQHYLSDRTGGFSGFGKHHGKKPTKKLLELRLIDSTKDLPKSIRHELQPPILYYSVVQILDGKPLAISRSYLPNSLPLEELEKTLEGVKENPSLSLYKTLESFGRKPTTCEELLTAEMPDEATISHLEIPDNIPVIQITRRTFDTSSYLVELCLMTLRADAHQLVYRFAL